MLKTWPHHDDDLGNHLDIMTTTSRDDDLPMTEIHNFRSYIVNASWAVYVVEYTLDRAVKATIFLYDLF